MKNDRDNCFIRIYELFLRWIRPARCIFGETYYLSCAGKYQKWIKVKKHWLPSAKVQSPSSYPNMPEPDWYAMSWARQAVLANLLFIEFNKSTRNERTERQKKTKKETYAIACIMDHVHEQWSPKRYFAGQVKCLKTKRHRIEWHEFYRNEIKIGPRRFIPAMCAVTWQDTSMHVINTFETTTRQLN